MRKTSTLAALFLTFVVTTLLAHHGPKTIKIDAAAAKQPGVTFNHHLHATSLVSKCETCHHTEKGMTATSDKDVKKCSTCHLKPKGNVPDMAAMGLKDNPFHIACINCHKEQKKGPTTCKQCHVKS